MKHVLISALLSLSLACHASARVRAVHSPGLIVIDLLEVYTSRAAAENGGPVGIEAKIRLAVDSLNADLNRSGIYDVRFRLVYVGQMDFRAESPADWNDPRVTALRDMYRADLVGIWSPAIGGGISLMPDRADPRPNAGFHAINSGVESDSRLLAHEIGHNLGLLHEDGVCRVEVPAFRDIMTMCDTMEIGAPPPPLYHGFTNPEMPYLGVTVTQDAAGIIRAVAPHVAAYR